MDLVLVLHSKTEIILYLLFASYFTHSIALQGNPYMASGIALIRTFPCLYDISSCRCIII